MPSSTTRSRCGTVSEKAEADSSLPSQPAEHVFDFDVTLGDDVGTNYSLKSSSRGGSGQMFRADWFFAPGPPHTARVLSVQVSGAEPVAIKVELDRGD